MDARRYRAMMGWFRARPAARRALYLLSRGAVAAVYVAYIGLLLVLAAWRQPAFWPAAVIPALTFWAGTALRAAIDRPRPYTALGCQPLFPKEEAGRSMPSRHCFSAAAIAVAAWHCCPPLGILLAALAVLIALSRVLSGVHYISDVVAGLAFGCGCALVGWQVYALAAQALAR